VNYPFNGPKRGFIFFVQNIILNVFLLNLRVKQSHVLHRSISLFYLKPVAVQKERGRPRSRASLFTECHFWWV